MKKYPLLLLAFVILLLSSCNHKIWVNKKYIVTDQNGYLVFTQGEVTFYPFNDTIDAKFLDSKSHREGYRVEFRTNWLDSMSIDYSSITEREHPKKFSIIPVQIRYYLGEMSGVSSDKSSFSYIWDGQKKTLKYEIDDWRQILSISVLRQREKELLKNLKFDRSWPPHD